MSHFAIKFYRFRWIKYHFFLLHWNLSPINTDVKCIELEINRTQSSCEHLFATNMKLITTQRIRHYPQRRMIKKKRCCRQCKWFNHFSLHTFHGHRRFSFGMKMSKMGVEAADFVRLAWWIARERINLEFYRRNKCLSTVFLSSLFVRNQNHSANEFLNWNSYWRTLHVSMKWALTLSSFSQSRRNIDFNSLSDENVKFMENNGFLSTHWKFNNLLLSIGIDNELNVFKRCIGRHMIDKSINDALAIQKEGRKK